MGYGDPDDPQGRQAWELQRIADPATGLVPAGIRKLELQFASGLPVQDEGRALTWQWRGPRNRGGRTRALAIDRTDPNVMLAGGVTGGVWRSTDGGASWSKTTDPGSLQSVSCIAQDPRPGREQVWYYGTGENYGVVSGTSFSALLAGDGIFKSTDGGQSWSQLPSTVGADPQNYTRNGSFKQVNGIVIDPNDTINDVVLAAVFNGIFRSTNGGITWTPVLGLDTTTTQTGTYSEIRATSDGVFYANVGNNSTVEGHWRSDDGINWTEITPTGFTGNVERTVIAIDPSDERIVYWFSQTPTIGTNGHSFWKYTYISGDGSGTGGNWEDRSDNLPNGSCTGYFSFDFGPINTQSSYDMCLAVHPTLQDVIYIGGTNIYRSTNGFINADSTRWIGGYRCNTLDPKDYVYPGHHPDQHVLLFSAVDPDVLYSASDGGVAKTTDALADSVMWTDLNTGYITSQFYTIHVEEGQATNDLLLGGTQDNGCWMALTDDINDDWAAVHQDDGAYCAIPEGQDFYLTSSQQGRLYKKTIDMNGNITGFERIDPLLGTSSYNFINQFVLDPLDNNKVYWVSASKIWRNNDLAGIPITDNWYDKITTNWELLGTANLPASQRITTLDISMAGRTLFYGTVNAHLYRLDSLDTTPVKTEISDGAWPGNAYMSCVATNDIYGDELLVTFSNYKVQSIWHSLDGGDTWAHVSGNLEENLDGSGSGPAVFWGRIYGTWGGLDNTYFVGTSTGLYSTQLLDGGNTIWVQEGAGSIGNIPINMIATRNSDGLIAVATHGNGVYSSFLNAAPISVGEIITSSPLGVFPNPAQDHVRIEIDLEHAGEVEMLVHDLAGKLVHSFDLGAMSVGSHARYLPLRAADGSSVRSGTYLLTCIQNNMPIATTKVVVQ